MSASARSTAVAQFRQGLILDAAREVFAQRGLEGATLRDIAARAGATTGAIYSQFASKEALYAELLGQSLAALHEAVAKAARSPRGRPRHAAAAKAFLRYYAAHPFEVNLGLYAFHGLKRQGLGAELDQRLNAALLATVRLLSPNDLPTDAAPDEAAMSTFVHLIGLLTLELAGRLQLGNSNAERLLDAYLQRRTS